jgi:hypothetical protein
MMPVDPCQVGNLKEIHDQSQQSQQYESREHLKPTNELGPTSKNYFIKEPFEKSTQEIDHDIVDDNNEEEDDSDDVCVTITTTSGHSDRVSMGPGNDSLIHLNQQQKEVVLAEDGVHIVVAGPGSGKTRVICYRIAHLIVEKGVTPEAIILLTFTNKAAKEMKERVISLVGMEKAHRIQMGTFHSVSARLIRLNASIIGISDRFTICDEDQASSIIKKIFTELNLTNKNQVIEEIFEKPKTILQAIQKLRNSQLPRNLTLTQRDLLQTFYSHYEIQKKHLNMLDFDDLLLHAIRLFEKCPQLANKIRYVLVDEVIREKKTDESR